MSTSPIIDSNSPVEGDIDFIEPKTPINYWADKWTLLPIYPSDSQALQLKKHRLNGFGSLYYFTKVILRKNRLNISLHKLLCDSLEKDMLREVVEVPRDHFKSTIFSEAAPMWWALPFSNKDADLMQKLGYSDEFIRWMRLIHDQDTRTLLISANIKNAIKLGRRVSFQYESNDLFRAIYKEILPTSSAAWSAESMTHSRTGTFTSAHGEGTYDFLGVGAALQSRHYPRHIKDDLVGLDALDSEKIMEGIIDYHRLTVGAYDSIPGRPDDIGDEVVVGNRWYYEDYNSYLRENEPDFNFTTHSAIGGCCDLHPYGTPIFPEEFSLKKLKRIETRLGPYFYSCQYLNSPTPPGQARFKEENLRWFNFDRIEAGPDQQGKIIRKIKIIHEVKEGEVLKDIMPAILERKMFVDPNHAGVEGRCRHAIIVIGYATEPDRMYLLDSWAEASNYDDFAEQIYKLSEKWKLKEIYLETIFGQKYVKAYLDLKYQNNKKSGKWVIDVIKELKADLSADAKAKRIESMETIYNNGMFWVNRIGQDAFLDEYRKYPYSKFKDLLDVTGYANQHWSPGAMSIDQIKQFLMKSRQHHDAIRRISNTGY